MLNETKEGNDKVVYRTPTKIAFSLGIMAGITITSLIAMAFVLLPTSTDDAGTTAVTNTDTVAAAPAAPAPTPAAPSKVDIEVKDDDHIRGDVNAPVTLVEYSDFECPFCARHLPTIDQILADYEGQVRFVYRHYPLSFHPEAQKAAEASECAGEQGQFWEMHDELFAMNNAGTLGVANFKSTAGDLGLNQTQFDDCLDTDKYAQHVTDDLAEGTTFGVSGTPATFVNGQMVSGAVPYASFTSIIDALL